MLYSPSLGYSQRPEQYLSEDEMKTKYGSVEDWYAANIRYISQFYNRYIEYIDPTRTMNNGSSNYNRYLGEADEIVENFLFFQGDQPNREYYHLVQDPMGYKIQSTNGASPAALIPTPWIKGHSVYRLVAYMQGAFSARIQAAQLMIENNSKSSRVKRYDMIDKATILYEFKDMFKKLEQENGVQYNPFPNKQFENLDDAIEWISKTPQERGEEVALKLVNNLVFRNGTKSIMEEAFLDVVVGRYTGIYCYIDGIGRLRQTIIPPQNLILDRRVDSDFGDGAEFVGYIEFLTPEEVVNKYPDLTKDEKKEILEQRDGFLADNSWNSTSNISFRWWNNQSLFKIACVTGFWKSYKDSRYVVENGEVKKLNPNQKNRKGDTYVEVVRKCTLIGNRYVTNYGLDEFMVKNPKDKSKVMLPILTCAPNTKLGYNKSIVDRIKQYQNNIDALENKINDSIAHDFGNVYIFDASKVKGMGAEELISDIKKHRFTFMNRVDGEELNYDDRRNIAEKVDMNLSQNVFRYIELQREKERLMEEVASISKIALGQQQTYVGLNTQQTTISQNTKGSEYIYSSIMKLFADVSGYSLEKCKLLALTKEGRDFIDEVVDDRIENFLETIKDFSFSDLTLKVKVEDIVDEQSKALLMQTAFAMAQGGLIDMLDYVKIIQLRTFQEISDYLEASMRRKKRESEQQMAYQALIQQANIQAQNQGLQQLEAMKQQGQNERAAAEISSDIGIEAMKMQQAQNQSESLPIRKTVRTTEPNLP